MKPYVVYVQNFNEKTGGVIVLHYLCHLLNELGYQACIWPSQKPFPDGSLRAWMGSVAYWVRRHLFRRYRTGPGFLCPVAGRQDLKDAIVIYPEVIAGNPLHADHVVRWMLYMPEHDFSDVSRYPDEMHFYYQQVFATSKTQCRPGQQLSLMWWNERVYRQTNMGQRTGTCYVHKKGSDIPLSHDLTDSICIDRLSHKEIARVLNEKQFLVCYDTHTAYMWFAMLCGCTPVVMPRPGVSKEQWRAEEEGRLGIAYGWDDVPWAVATRQQGLEVIRKRGNANLEMVRRFVRSSQDFFNGHKPQATRATEV